MSLKYNDFIIESNEITLQSSIVESTTSGSVNSVNIINRGDGYEIGDNAIFDNTNTNGGGLSVSVNSITGKDITSVNTTVDTFDNTSLFGQMVELFQLLFQHHHL